MKMMKDAFVVEIRRYWTAERSKTSRSPRWLFLPYACDIAPCRVGLCSMTHLCCALLLDLLCLTASLDAFGREELCQVPIARLTSRHWCQNI
jgi:hypothetical protein